MSVPRASQVGSPAEQGLWVTIGPSRGLRALDPREIWRARELALTLAKRDLRVRYKQAAVGVAWALFQPLIQTAMFAIVLGRFVGVPSDGLPYSLFVLSALVLWQLFAKCVTEGSTSLVANQALLTKVYFPRVLIPAVSGLTGLVDFLCAFPVLMGIALLYGVTPGPGILATPFFVALAVMTGLTVAIWLSALDVAYRDIRFLLSPVVQFWLYATPVVYPASLVPARWRLLYALNPMVGAVEGFRWAVLGGATSAPNVPLLAASTAGVLVALAAGLVVFARMDRVFADRV